MKFGVTVAVACVLGLVAATANAGDRVVIFNRPGYAHLQIVVTPPTSQGQAMAHELRHRVHRRLEHRRYHAEDWFVGPGKAGYRSPGGVRVLERQIDELGAYLEDRR